MGSVHELPAELVQAAHDGDDAAIDSVLAYFEDYIQGWSWRESRAHFWGIIDQDDLANMLRGQVWIAIKKFDAGRCVKNSAGRGFVLLAKSLMAAKLWADRKQLNRQKRMPRKKSDDKTRSTWARKTAWKTRAGGRLRIRISRVVKGEYFYDSLPVIQMSQIEENQEVDRLIKAMRVEIDFDFDIFLQEMTEMLAKKDPFLAQILQRLWLGLSPAEIAAEIGIKVTAVRKLIKNDIRSLLTTLQLAAVSV